MDTGLGFGARLWLWVIVPWKVLFDGVFAARVQAVLDGPPALEAATEKADETPEKAEETAGTPEPLAPEPVAAGTDPTAALQLLGLLQREGRFVDFLQEDVTDFSDEDIGAAARVVHSGCRRALAEALEVKAIRAESEGDDVTLEAGFDAQRVRLTGDVAGEPPYRGQLAHHGWEVARIELPTLTEGHDARVVAPAEVELQS